MTKPLRIQAQGAKAEIFVYGVIGSESGQISADLFQKELKQLGNISALTIHINSDGGSVSEVLAIHSLLARSSTKVRVEIDGFALSAASLLAMAGNPIVMAENAIMMLHEPWMSQAGSADELRKGADALDTVREQMAEIYAKRSGQTTGKVLELLAAETWLSAEEAVALGFADEIAEALPIAASFDLNRFNIPDRLKEAIMPKPTQAQPDATQAAVQAALAAEKDRRTQINQIFTPHAENHRELLAQCLDDMEVTPDMASRKLLAELGRNVPAINAQLGVGPISVGGHERGKEFRAAARDALLIRNGIRVKEPAAGAEDLRRMSIVSMAESCLSMTGARPVGPNPNKILNAAFAHSTSDFPFLLSDVAEKALMKGFEDEPASHTAWVHQTEVRDFKDIHRVQRSEAPKLLKVPEGSEFKEGSFGERRETYRVETYGRIFSITRQALINDDLGAFTMLPQAFGASARRVEADHVYEVLTGNPTMSDGVALFHTDHGNLASSGTTITVAALSTARASMRRQKGVNGAILNIVPRFLIVPATLEGAAESLLASLTWPDQDNPGVMNLSFIRALDLVVDPRLDEHDETAWYLAGSPSQIDTIELAYLEGQRGLYTEEKEGWEVDGYSVKARLDFGTAAIDWKGLYRNPGAT